MPDFLSRIATVVVEPGWLGRVARAQHSAPELGTFLAAARGQDPTFVLCGGGEFPVLYRVSAGHDQLILPAAGGFCELVLAELHDSRLGGHLDSRRMLAALQLHVWWPGMRADVAAYVASCPTCQRVKDSMQKQQGPLQPLAPPTERFSSYTMDFIFGLPHAKGRDGVWRDGVMTVVDRATKERP